MKPKALLIRADAGLSVGTGHVMRMFALAEAWLELGGEVTFLGHVPDALTARGKALGVDMRQMSAGADAAQTRACAEQVGAHWVAADGYAFTEVWQRDARSNSVRLMIVDDNAENRPYAADCVLNVNVHATEAMYVARSPVTRLLLGPTYALIRSEFRRALAVRQVPAFASRWLVTMGGSDPVDATGQFLAAIADSNLAGVSIEVLVGPANPRGEAYASLASRSPVPVALSSAVSDVTVPMARADLALSASGGTVWELALMGVPAAVVSLAPNQAQLAASLAALGVAVPLGEAKAGGDGHGWLSAMKSLASNAQSRTQMLSRACTLVDGQGPFRVARALREESFDARV